MAEIRGKALKIQIDEKYWLLSDEHNFIVAKEKGDKTKKIHHISFHTSLANAVQELLRIKIKKTKSSTLEELLVELRQMRGAVERKIGI